MDYRRSQGYDGLQTMPPAGLEPNSDYEALEMVQPEEDYQMKTMEATTVNLGPQRTGKDPWKRRAIWIAIFLGTLLVISAVAGGVAGSIAVRDARNTLPSCPPTTIQNITTSSNVTSENSTNSSMVSYTLNTAGHAVNLSVPISTMVETVALDCPSIDAQVHTSVLGAIFAIQCGVDLAGADIVGMIAYNLYDCIDACSSMNSFNVTDKACKAVTFTKTMSNSAKANNGANCWLKSAANPAKKAAPDASARLIG